MGKKIVFLVIAVVVIVGCIFLIMRNGDNKDKEVASENNAEGTTLSIKYDNVEVTPGKEFKAEQIKEEANVSEIQSCAFDGMDKVYTYENFEVTVASVDGKDTIYSVYFDNDEVATTEGVRVTDTKDKMIEKYGTEYKEELGNKYIYKDGNVELSFIIENDIITAIEYTLVTE